jgi:hypothetical protein
MAQDNEYVQKLIAARDREVAHRRNVAEVLAEKHNRGDMENMKSRTRLKPSSVPFGMRDIAGQKSEPFSPFGFTGALPNMDRNSPVTNKPTRAPNAAAMIKPPAVSHPSLRGLG